MGEGDDQQREVSAARRPRITTIRTLVLLASLIVAIATIVAWLCAPPDPLYKGKRLSAYLYEMVPPPPLPPTQRQAFFQDLERRRKEAQEATVALGPKAIPLISQWLKSKSELKLRLRTLALTPGSRLAWLRRFSWITREPGDLALNAASFIPAHGAPLLPLLRELALSEQQSLAMNASRLFGDILDALPKEESRKIVTANLDLFNRLMAGTLTDINTPIVLALLRNFPPEQAETTIRRIFALRAQVSLAEFAFSKLDPDETIVNLLYLETGIANEKSAAALFFRDKGCMPERVVPLLMTNLALGGSGNLLRNLCNALAAYGTNATPALPQLTNLLAHPRPAVREAASNAVARIAGR